MIYCFLYRRIKNWLAVDEQTNDYDQTENFSEKELEKSKKIAVEFATAFHNYNAEKPMEYLENAKTLYDGCLI